MTDQRLSVAVLGADCTELARDIGGLALRAGRLGAYGTASALIDAIPTLIDSLSGRAGAEIDAARMELAKVLTGLPAEVTAAGRAMREQCENCGEFADGKSRDEVPLCERCAAEIAEATR